MAKTKKKTKQAAAKTAGPGGDVWKPIALVIVVIFLLVGASRWHNQRATTNYFEDLQVLMNEKAEEVALQHSDHVAISQQTYCRHTRQAWHNDGDQLCGVRQIFATNSTYADITELEVALRELVDSISNTFGLSKPTVSTQRGVTIESGGTPLALINPKLGEGKKTWIEEGTGCEFFLELPNETLQYIQDQSEVEMQVHLACDRESSVQVF